MRDIQGWIDETVPLKQCVPEDVGVPPEPLDLPDEDLLRVMLASKDGALVERFLAGNEGLWEGEGKRYESRSNADLGFFRKLAYYARGDKDRMKRIAFSSGMRRKKWERDDYLANTINLAVASCEDDYYNPEYSSKPRLMAGFLEVWASIDNPKLRRAFGALLSNLNAYGNYTRAGYLLEAHGKMYVMPEEGLWTYASLRGLGVWMGEREVSTISRRMKSLREAGLVVKVSEGKGNKATLYLLPSSLIPSGTTLQHRRETQCVKKEYIEGYTVLLCCRGEQTPCPSLLCVHGERDPHPYLDLLWTLNKPKEGKPGLTDDQKSLLEYLLIGGFEDLDHLAGLLKKSKQDVTEIVTPLSEMGLITAEGGDEVRLANGFGEAIHEIFVLSGGAEARRKAEEEFEKDREFYRTWNASRNGPGYFESFFPEATALS